MMLPHIAIANATTCVLAAFIAAAPLASIQAILLFGLSINYRALRPLVI